MLKGFLSLILIFGAGILLMSLGMPKEFAIVQDYTRDGYERVVATFTKDNNILAEEENVLPATPEPLIKTDTGPVRNTS